MRLANSGEGRGESIRQTLALSASILLAFALAGCAPVEPGAPNPAGAPTPRPLALSSTEFAADLVTPAGIRVKTNGQYKSQPARKSAADAIDRYWGEVRACAVGVEPANDRDVAGLIEQFPRYFAIEISDNWKIVQGPTTHRKMQAFPSVAHPGTWSTARRQVDALYVVVVPELSGLGPQMVNELNLWIMKNADVPPTVDLGAACASIPCLKFDYDNAPSQAWSQCK